MSEGQGGPSPEATSRNIPLPIQRAVRQRCGFGCVICGFPLYDYDHLLGWANVKRHVAEEITLLCDVHHREKTSGLLPNVDVLDANSNPHNLRQGVSKPYDLHFSGDECQVSLGSNSFTAKNQGYGTVLVPVSVDGVPLLAFILADSHLLLNVNAFDDDNNLVLRITNNQLVYSVRPWDIQLIAQTLTIREAKAKILIEIRFDVPNRVVVNRGRFLLNGVEILLRPELLLVTNNRLLLTNCNIRGSAGLLLGPHPEGLSAVMHILNIPRYLGDRSDAIKWAEEMMADKENAFPTSSSPPQ